MDNIFRPSHAFPAVEDHESVFHEFIGNQITKDIEKLAEEVWSKFSIRTSTPEEHEALHTPKRNWYDIVPGFVENKGIFDRVKFTGTRDHAGEA